MCSMLCFTVFSRQRDMRKVYAAIFDGQTSACLASQLLKHALHGHGMLPANIALHYAVRVAAATVHSMAKQDIVLPGHLHPLSANHACMHCELSHHTVYTYR